MNMKQCKNGHFYDPSKFSSCPYCGVADLDIDIGMTMQKNTSSSDNSNHTMPIGRGENKEGRTIGMYKKKLGLDPVVGWIVCIEGAEKGRDYRIRSEKNFIGRSEKMDICINGDASISRENHAIISFNPKKQRFKIYAGDGRGLVYLNDDEVIIPTDLNAYDIIEIGESKFTFIPFCGEMFKWD